ncbi:MAG: hypothetical protein AAGB34_06690 [Planctomycetota bacterium]
MAINPVDMLKRLGSGIHPDGSALRRAHRPVESIGFTELLSRAKTNDTRAERPIHFESPDPDPDDSESDPLSFTDHELREIGRFVDAAEIEGIERLAVMVGGRLALVSVHDREITEVTDDAAHRLLGGVGGIAVLREDTLGDEIRLGIEGRRAELAGPRLWSARDASFLPAGGRTNDTD